MSFGIDLTYKMIVTEIESIPSNEVTVLAAAQVPVVVEYDLQKDVRSSWCSR